MTVFSSTAMSLRVPGLVLLQFNNNPRMFADKQDLGIPDPGKVGEPGGLTGDAGKQDLGIPDPGEVEEPGGLTGDAGLPEGRAEPPGSPWLWWNPVLSRLQGEPPVHRIG
jgi:hypothetical protein